MSGNTSGHGKNGSGKWVAMGSAPWVVWTGAGTPNAPTLEYNSVGFNLDGISTAGVYHYNADTDTWTDTTSTVSKFFGGV